MSNKKISEFKIGEVVVYPKHGVGEIIKIESMEVSSIKTKFYVVKMEQAKLTIRVPLEKQEEVGLRKISTKKIIDQVFDVLKLILPNKDLLLIQLLLFVFATKVFVRFFCIYLLLKHFYTNRYIERIRREIQKLSFLYLGILKEFGEKFKNCLAIFINAVR